MKNDKYLVNLIYKILHELLFNIHLYETRSGHVIEKGFGEL